MNQWLKIGSLVSLVVLMIACEDATVDYASDIVGDYIVKTAIIDGINTDYSILPLEEAWIIDITKDNLLSYENEVNQCDSTYNLDVRVIDSVSDTAIVFDDDTRLYYSISGTQLTLSNDDDVITLVKYGSVLPPPSWTDPSQLTNDIYEPDNSLGQATRISAAGAIHSHYSAVCDDDDYFIFEALGGTSYVIEAEAEASSDIDLTISLFSVSGDSAGYSDDQTTTNVDPLLEWACINSGDYYFIIKKYWDYLDPGNSADDEKGAYTVSVDVTKALLKAPDPEIIKRHRSAKATHLRHKFFD